MFNSAAIHSIVIETGEKYLKTTNFNIKINAASSVGDNFFGIVNRLTYETCDNSFCVILKIAPTNAARRTVFETRQFFLREIFTYNKVLPLFAEYQQIKSAHQHGFNEYPKCYNTLDAEANECLLIEDMTASGFSMFDRTKVYESMTVEHVDLIMKALGKLHAISFALKDQQSDKFKQIVDNLSEFCLSPNYVQFVNYLSILQKNVKSALVTDTDLIERVNSTFDKHFSDIANDCVKSESIDSYAVICHGDCWINNALFKYDEWGKAIDVRLIDWQITRYASPVTDIIYFLFGSVNKQLRNSHYEHFLNTYYSCLCDHLKRLGLNPEELFPRSVMLKHLKKFGKLGLIVGTMYINDLTADENSTSNLDEICEQFLKTKTWNDNDFVSKAVQDVFHQRIRDLVIDLIQLNYI